MTTFAWSIFSFLVLFAIVAGIHEFGHFLAARLSGVRVLEFSLGFGPKLFGRKSKETQFSARAIPLGGYVRIAGMSPDEESREEAYPPEESYQNKPALSKLFVCIAGSLANILTAFIIFSFIFMFIGMPILTNEIESIVPGSPAERIGLNAGDKIEKVGEIEVIDEESILNAVALIHKSSRKIHLKILRHGRTHAFSVAPEYDPEFKVSRIGFTLKVTQERKGVFSSVFEGLKSILVLTLSILYTIWQLIFGNISIKESFIGPIGIARITGEAARAGAFRFISLLAMINVFLGVFNLMPMPPLDGGRILFVGIEAITRKRVNPKLEKLVAAVGWALLLTLMIVVTKNDIMRLMGR